ncbi:MAG: phosphoribosylamine--glycine ligase [Candidatus Levyibacteriota bacterium]
MKENGKTVVVIGGGGREAALVHKYSQSPNVSRIIAIPGNDLMQINSKVLVKIFKNIQTTDTAQIIKICKEEKADLIDVTQDNAIEAGLVDALSKMGFNVVGPSKTAGQIEWDKSWARDFMKKNKLPIPSYKVFKSQEEATEFINKSKDKKWFIKAAGLAEGKGVIPAQDKKEALAAISEIKKLGKAGKTFIIEEGIVGEEFSMFAVTDGKTYQIIGTAQDHKRLYDGDLGPNTGGVGSSTPALVVDRSVYKQARQIIEKTINGLASEGRKYKGILYFGGIVAEKKVIIIEFNARWGDPEAEVLVPGIQNDMFELGMHVVKENLKDIKLMTDSRARVAVTGSIRPGVADKRRELFGIDKVLKLKDVTLYGTRVSKKNGRYFVSSGRLFHVVGVGKDVLEARMRAYGALSLLNIEGDNLYYRTDIGWRDVERLEKNSV